MTPLQYLPATGLPEQLLVLLHGVGATPLSMLPLARALRREFPQGAVVAPPGFDAFDGAGAPNSEAERRQWFSIADITEQNRPARVAAVLPRLIAWVRETQQRLQAAPAATALVGFSQGGLLCLEMAHAQDGLAGRVLSFAGRYAVLPEQAPRCTTLHLLHGSADTVIAAEHSRLAFERLNQLHGDATIDIAEGIGHELHPVLVASALHRLRTHIPHRTWQAAMGAVPPPPGPAGTTL
jgi:phospholipase/carboxylesterase